MVETTREVIENILSEKIKLVTVDVDKEFVYFDKLNNGQWRVTITKSLYKE